MAFLPPKRKQEIDDLCSSYLNILFQVLTFHSMYCIIYYFRYLFQTMSLYYYYSIYIIIFLYQFVCRQMGSILRLILSLNCFVILNLICLVVGYMRVHIRWWRHRATEGPHRGGLTSAFREGRIRRVLNYLLITICFITSYSYVYTNFQSTVC